MSKAKTTPRAAQRKPQKKEPDQAATRAFLADLGKRGFKRAKIGGFDIDGVLRGKYVSLDKLESALSKGFGSLAILPVHADANRPAIRVLIRGVKGGKAPVRVLSGLMLNDESGLPNKEVAEMLSGKRALPLASP